MNRRLLICILFVLADVITAIAAEEAITRDWLVPNYFADLRVNKPGEIIFTMRDSGARFYVQQSGAEEKVPEYNEQISVHTGESISFSSRHGSMSWELLPKPLDQKGWLIESRVDERSVGRGKIVRYGIALLIGGNQLRFIEPEKNFNPALPPDDPTWQKISKMVSDTELLSEHELFAQTSTGNAPPPFSASTTGIVFRWKIQNASEPVEIRWIAEEVNGVEKDHVIATSQSEPNKQSGQFSLTKPTNGFPAGKYRVEIWQSGKEIYREAFEITP